ncbi:MAG: glycosyl hydrolase 53 family protein [Muribaculaceae bacterium]
MMIRSVQQVVMGVVLMMCVAPAAWGEQKPYFSQGADIGWVTEMEDRGLTFYNRAGEPTDCFVLMKQLGMDCIRLRVWVNPQKRYNATADVVAKAVRAQQAGMDVMLDFHYSDNWADPGQQRKPRGWRTFTARQVAQAVYDHTTQVLQSVKQAGVKPRWIQVGNEITNGLLWDTNSKTSGALYTETEGRLPHRANSKNFARYVAAGCKAVRQQLPEAQIIIHLDRGMDMGKYKTAFDVLKRHHVDYDIVGMSIYSQNEAGSSFYNPLTGTTQTASTVTDVMNAMFATMDFVYDTYGKQSMITEVGFKCGEEEVAQSAAYMRQLMDMARQHAHCLGIYYWEPESSMQWNRYPLGAFSNGRPTAIMDAWAR